MRYSFLIIILFISSCSTKQGFYDSDDPDHDEFSVVNTVLSVGAAAAIIIGGKEVVDSMGNSYSGDSYAWDWQPGNQTWVCRNRNNGQYASHDKCPTLTSSTPDGWP